MIILVRSLQFTRSQYVELEIQLTKVERMKVVNNYIKMNCDKQGKAKDSDILTEAEENGRRKILDGIKTKGWLLYTSDKSGKMVLDTRENFLKCMEEHFVNDPVVSHDEVRKGERVLNTHSKCKGPS